MSSIVFRSRARWILLALLLPVFGHVAAGDDFDRTLAQIQSRWAIIQYQTDDKSKAGAFENLAKDARGFSERHPGRAEPLVWESIVLSSYAGSLQGMSKLGAMQHVKKARDLLIKAERIDPDVLNGSVYTSLGALYYKVPGWPLGFGNSEQAMEYLRKALAINPDGIDPNFFMGELLHEQGRHAEALAALEKALQAPPREGRELADAGRRKEVEAIIAKVRRSL